VVKALRYNTAGRGFDSRWCYWNFSVTQSFRSHYGPGVDSASKRIEYQVYFLGVKVATIVILVIFLVIYLKVKCYTYKFVLQNNFGFHFVHLNMHVCHKLTRLSQTVQKLYNFVSKLRNYTNFLAAGKKLCVIK
jgi:hypothetical protein